LEQLHKDKYHKLIYEVSSIAQVSRQDFKIERTDLHEMQELVQSSLGRVMSYDDYFDLFKPDVSDFFFQFNKQVKKEFNLEEIS